MKVITIQIEHNSYIQSISVDTHNELDHSTCMRNMNKTLDNTNPEIFQYRPSLLKIY